MGNSQVVLQLRHHRHFHLHQNPQILQREMLVKRLNHRHLQTKVLNQIAMGFRHPLM